MFNNRNNSCDYPEGKKFAFSIFDDTDVATLEYIKPIYDYLYEVGIATTKTTWSFDYDGNSHYSGTDTLANSDYSDYLILLKSRGFEIGFHGATMESSNREKSIGGLEFYKEVFGEYPSIYAAHSQNKENLYWGNKRLSSPIGRFIYKTLMKNSVQEFEGDDSSSPYFWGDLASKHLNYVRSFTFSKTNLSSLKTPIVYQSGSTPHVNNWFISSDADNVEEFNHLLSSKNQDRLESQGGICIVSTHFGKGFVKDGELHPVTKRLIKELSERDGWFVPVSQLLQHYVTEVGVGEIGNLALSRLEVRWIIDSVLRKLRSKAYDKTEAQYLES